MTKEKELRQIIVELQMESGMEVKFNILKIITDDDGEEHRSGDEERCKNEAVVNAAVALVAASRAYLNEGKYVTKTTVEKIIVSDRTDEDSPLL